MTTTTRQQLPSIRHGLFFLLAVSLIVGYLASIAEYVFPRIPAVDARFDECKAIHRQAEAEYSTSGLYNAIDCYHEVTEKYNKLNAFYVMWANWSDLWFMALVYAGLTFGGFYAVRIVKAWRQIKK